jgi:hypothetical protein
VAQALFITGIRFILILERVCFMNNQSLKQALRKLVPNKCPFCDGKGIDLIWDGLGPRQRCVYCKPGSFYDKYPVYVRYGEKVAYDLFKY